MLLDKVFFVMPSPRYNFLPTGVCKQQVEGGPQDTGGGRLAKKAIGRWEVPEFWTGMCGGLDFASQFRDVRGFVLKRFSQK